MMTTLPPLSGNSPTRRIRRPDRQSRGQSLVEFICVVPILFLVLLAGGNVGIGAYQAHLASDAVRQPLAQKLALGGDNAAVSGAKLLGFANNSAVKSQIKLGQLLDQVTVSPIDNYNSVITGTKTFNPIVDIPSIPSFTIQVKQVINGGLLQPAATGGTARPVSTPWVPNGAPVKPPWEA